MAKKPIDLDRVRRANARLDQLIRDHPELVGETSGEDWLDIIEGVLLTQDVYPLEEAADVLNIDQEVLREAIEAGKLKAVLIGGDFQISREALREFYRAHGD